MNAPHFSSFVEREITPAVYRKNVQIHFRPASDLEEQGRLMSTAIALASIARSFDPAFTYRVEHVGHTKLLLEFELNFPNRFGSAVDEWIREDAKIHPEILEAVLPGES